MSEQEPLLLRAARGEEVERTPVWMMRQAGRHMAVYRALVSKYPTFRERSETPEVRRTQTRPGAWRRPLRSGSGGGGGGGAPASHTVRGQRVASCRRAPADVVSGA